jgi:predicted nucleic acid-binding protein
MIVTLDAKRRLTVPAALAPASPGDYFDAQFDAEEDALVFRRLAQGELADGTQSLSGQPGRCAAAPPRACPPAQAVSWLRDTDVICQPAKRHGDARVIAWLELEQDRCYTSAIVIAQLAYRVRTKEGRQRQSLQAWLTRLVDALQGRIHGFNVSVAHVWAGAGANTRQSRSAQGWATHAGRRQLHCGYCPSARANDCDRQRPGLQAPGT